MAGARRRKLHLYDSAGISAPGEIWLIHNARSQWTLEGREKAQMGRAKKYV